MLVELMTHDGRKFFLNPDHVIKVDAIDGTPDRKSMITYIGGSGGLISTTLAVRETPQEIAAKFAARK
jgi:hypothetical protein